MNPLYLVVILQLARFPFGIITLSQLYFENNLGYSGRKALTAVKYTTPPKHQKLARFPNLAMHNSQVILKSTIIIPICVSNSVGIKNHRVWRKIIDNCLYDYNFMWCVLTTMWTQYEVRIARLEMRMQVARYCI